MVVIIEINKQGALLALYWKRNIKYWEREEDIYGIQILDTYYTAVFLYPMTEVFKKHLDNVFGTAVFNCDGYYSYQGPKQKSPGGGGLLECSFP